jgi:addiction module HigA family antidote
VRPARPGELVRAEILRALNRPASRATEILRVRRATLSDLVNGKAALSPELALRMAKAFGVSMDTRLRMPAWRDSHTMRQGAAEVDVERYEPARSYLGRPVRQSSSSQAYDGSSRTSTAPLARRPGAQGGIFA